MDSPSATYRGFRNQALFVLARLLTDSDRNEKIYHPEGGEDLAVYQGPRLIEVMQVKDFTSALAVSHFKPGSPEGFFARMRRRREEHPGCKHTLVSFGALGPEFAGAISGEHEHREAVVSKMIKAIAERQKPRVEGGKKTKRAQRSSTATVDPSKPQANAISLSRDEAALLLEELRGNVVFVNADELRASIVRALEGTSAGAHIDTAIELLLFWIFDASENLRPLTRSTVLQQIQNVGLYLGALRDSTSEWGSNLRQIRDEALSEADAGRLRAEYQQGTHANWRHILAKADVQRPSKLQELHHKLSIHSTVVIRGASGQGKSTLGWRYMHDYGVDGLRFQVRLVDGREHAVRIANALKGHVQRLQMHAIVYLDLSPADRGWSELIKDLNEEGMKVVVAVREEDFRRETVASGSIDAAEVVLDAVSYEEAKAMFVPLMVAGPVGAATDSPLDFEEAWAKFGGKDGVPLLEFAHGVTQGKSLRDKLNAQVLRLQHESSSTGSGISPAHITLLGAASIAAAAGCLVDLALLCECVSLDPLTRPLAYLEDEYLLKVFVGDRPLVGGLHAIRSQVIVESVLRDCPQDWPRLACQVIPCIVDSHLETFLLFGFSRFGRYRADLERILPTLRMRSWAHVGSVVRGLVWEGLNRYEIENNQKLAEAIKRYGKGWFLAMDASVGMTYDAAASSRDTMASLGKPVTLTVLTPKKKVFKLLREWAQSTSPPDVPPQDSAEWVDVGDAAFWLTRSSAEGLLAEAVVQLLPDVETEPLRLSDLASFISGRAAVQDDGFKQWLNDHDGSLAAMFVRVTNSIHLDDDGSNLVLYCPMILDDNPDVARRRLGPDDWHGRVMDRLELLRQVYPYRKNYGSQGFLIEFSAGAVDYDSTQKRIPVENFPDHREVDLNARFSNIVTYRHMRSPAWSSYVDRVVEFRRFACTALEAISHCWKGFLIPGKVPEHRIKRWPGETVQEALAFTKLPSFPRTIVDEWGFVSENKNITAPPKQAGLGNNLRRFDKLQKTLSDYSGAVSTVLAQCGQVSVDFVRFRNEGSSPDAEGSGRLVLINVGNAWANLYEVVIETRRALGPLLVQECDTELESREEKALSDLWFVAYSFCFSPRGVAPASHLALRGQVSRKRETFLQQLGSKIGAALDDIVEGSSVRIDGARLGGGLGRYLRVICDHNNLDSIDETRVAVVSCVAEAAQSAGWLLLEWQPLEVEWPKIAIIHLFRGKALAPSAVLLNTSVFLSQPNQFEVQPHHILEVAIPVDEFANQSILIWDDPTLRKVYDLVVGLSRFAMSAGGYEALLETIESRGLPVASIERPLAQFGRVLHESWRELLNEYNLVRSLLASFVPLPDEPDSLTEWQDTLEDIFCPVAPLSDDAGWDPSFEELRAWASFLSKHARCSVIS